MSISQNIGCPGWRFVAIAVVACSVACHARDFTVADEIAMVHFGDPYTHQAQAVTFSPSGDYFVVDTERGLLDQNCPESTLRLYRRSEVRNFVRRSERPAEPRPLWEFSLCTFTEGPIITHIRWLRDATGIAFLAKSPLGNDQLFLADIESKTVQPLTPEDRQVTAFDMRDRLHFVYSVLSSRIQEEISSERGYVSVVGNGRSLTDLMFPDNLYLNRHQHDKSELWAVINGKRSRVPVSAGGGPLVIYTEGQNTLALSPDGDFAVSSLPLKAVPFEWDRLYRPAGSSYPRQLPAGPQALQASNGLFYVSVYVIVDLRTGETTPITSTPVGNAVGWWNSDSQADWADDGKSVVLPNTFLPSTASSDTEPRRPCIVVAQLKSATASCVVELRGPTSNGFENGWRSVQSVHFIGGDTSGVEVRYRRLDGSQEFATYLVSEDKRWRETTTDAPEGGGDPHQEMQVMVQQALNSPPMLVAKDKEISRVILDPNPQLRAISFGEASIVSFTGRDQVQWFAGLYKPPRFDHGRRYPLVIQTHGFVQGEFDPSGIFPTAFAARELAAAGILVLQVPECPNYGTPSEASCNALRYKTAVEKLVEQGLVDPKHVGIVGFSRTCFHVIHALAKYPDLFAAASITDGINGGYLQYLASVDQIDNLLSKDYDAMIGARPFGEGLRFWLLNSPTFNMDKVRAPLQVVANGRPGLLEMWEPYATLRYLNKPVDLVMLQQGTHVLTNPRQRLASQGGTVDWFQFWLQGKANPDPAKKFQYARWHHLRALQVESEKGLR